NTKEHSYMTASIRASGFLPAGIDRGWSRVEESQQDRSASIIAVMSFATKRQQCLLRRRKQSRGKSWTRQSARTLETWRNAHEVDRYGSPRSACAGRRLPGERPHSGRSSNAQSPRYDERGSQLVGALRRT